MAYGRTFLQLVNDVLRELREDEVLTWSDTEYSKLIGQWINASKSTAENAWQWTALRETFSVPTVLGTVTYTLTGTDERAQVLDGWNQSTGKLLSRMPWRGMNAEYFSQTTTPTASDVAYWSPNGLNPATGEYQLDVFPPPSGAQALKFTVYAPQPELDSDNDVMLVPSRPVVEGTVARARYERGEDGGVSFDQQQVFMLKALSDYIARDAAQNPEDLHWEAV